MEADEPGKKPKEIILGEDLYLLSIEELEERIAACKAEIERIEADIEKKRATRAAADAVFR